MQVPPVSRARYGQFMPGGPMIPNIPIPDFPEVDPSEFEAIKPKLTGPKRQHVIPRFYLNGFSRSELLAVYDRDQKEHRIQPLSGTTVINHYYTYEDVDGRRRYDVEHMFSTFESAAAPVIRKLAARERISNDEVRDLANFISTMAFRTTDMIDSTKAMHEQFVRRMIKTTYGTVGSTIATLRRHPENENKTDAEIEQEAMALREFALGDGFSVEVDHQWAVGTSLHSLSRVPSILMQRNWTVVHTDPLRKSFVTSDAPVVLTTMMPRPRSPYGIGYANVDAVVFFPLTQSCGVLIWGQGDQVQHEDMGDEDLRHMNCMVADRCQRFLISRDEALNRSLVRFLNLGKKVWQPKMSIR